MSGKRTHRLLRTWILPLTLLAMAAPAGAAAKLIHMNNGKVLRVESVQADGEWLMVALEGGHSLGIRAALVAQVEDDLGDDNDFGEALNVVTSGRYVPRGRANAAFSNRQGGRARTNNALTEEKDPNAAVPAQPTPGGVVVPPGQQRGVGVQPGTGQRVQPGAVQPGAAQQGRNLTPSRRSGFRNRPNNN